MSFLFTLFVFIIVISILVFVHEYGHFWVARRMGVKVEAFSIGFGKELFGFYDKHGTRWKFSLIPMGGYVKMFGDKNEASAPDQEALNNFSLEEKKLAFQFQPLWSRALILVAGPLANYLFAIVIFTSFFSLYGIPFAEATISKMLENGPAIKAGLMEGDKILSINNHKIDGFTDISKIMDLSTGEAVSITIQRRNETYTKTIIPEILWQKDILGHEIKTYKLGIMANNISYTKHNIFSSAKFAFIECFNLSYMSLKGLGQIITGTRSVKELGGPIKIAQYSAKTAEHGIASLLWFMALLSVNLGFLNLLPIPALDGGHLLLYAVEFLFGKKNASKVQNFSFQIGLILIIMLSVFVTFNDLTSLIKG